MTIRTLCRKVCAVLVALLVLCSVMLSFMNCPTVHQVPSAVLIDQQLTTSDHQRKTLLDSQAPIHQPNKPGVNQTPVHQPNKPSVNQTPVHQPNQPGVNQTPVHQPNQPNLQDMLDIVPDSKLTAGVFPKPAPPLYLSMDNNALNPDHQLYEGLVKPNVHFVWCGKRWFEFRMYLSIVSIIRAVQPDKVLFHYEIYPPVDGNMYNLWMDDLKHDYQFFETQKMEARQSELLCRSDHKTKITAIGQLMGKIGGIYISEGAWILNFPAEERKKDIIMALDENLEGYLMLRGGIVSDKHPLPDVIQYGKFNISHHSCSSAHHIYQGVQSDCMIVRGGKFETIYPMDYVYLQDDPFAKIVRQLFHGSEVVRKPEPNYDTLVPNIGHMIWIGGGEMDYVFFLSVLSMLYVVRVDVVYIHGDQPPTGIHWARLCAMTRARSRVKLVARDPPSYVYQGAIQPYYRALMSDILRVDLMIKHGGVYTDTDAIWARPLSREERAYDAVATYDWVDWSYPYPDTVNFGVSYGKRNAPFYRLFRDSMRLLNNDLHGFTGVAMPYKILEKHPGLLRIDRRLGVICYYSRCHPLWEKDYHNMTHDHVVAKSIRNWREDVHAFHWTHPNPTELHNETILLKSTGIFAELGKFVLQQAGILAT